MSTWSPSRSSAAAQRVATLGATPVSGDLDDAPSLERAFKDVQVLVNLASLGFGHAPAIVNACLAADVERAGFVSTTSVFTKTKAASRPVRLAAEETIKVSALKWTIVRPTMIYGAAEDRNMARLLHLIARYPVVVLPGGGSRLQQPVHVADLASAIVTAFLDGRSVGKCYNIAGPEPSPSEVSLSRRVSRWEDDPG